MSRVFRSNADGWRGLGYAFLVVAIFSSFILISRAGLTTSLAAADLAFLRFGTSAFLLLPYFILKRLCGLTILQAVALASLGGVGFALLAYSGFSLAPAAHGGIFLHGTLLLTTALILRTLNLCDANRASMSAIFISGLGVAVMAWSVTASLSYETLKGDVCLLLASFCWSGYAIWARKLGIKPIDAASIVAVISASLFIPPYLLYRGDELLNIEMDQIVVQAIFQGGLIGVVSIFVYTRAVSLLGASAASACTSAVPVVTTFGALLFLSETPPLIVWAGVALVSLGSLMPLLQRQSTCSG